MGWLEESTEWRLWWRTNTLSDDLITAVTLESRIFIQSWMQTGSPTFLPTDLNFTLLLKCIYWFKSDKLISFAHAKHVALSFFGWTPPWLHSTGVFRSPKIRGTSVLRDTLFSFPCCSQNQPPRIHWCLVQLHICRFYNLPKELRTEMISYICWPCSFFLITFKMLNFLLFLSPHESVNTSWYLNDF